MTKKSETVIVEDSECKCCICDKQDYAFWPCIDPDISQHPYCEKCLAKKKARKLSVEP